MSVIDIEIYKIKDSSYHIADIFYEPNSYLLRGSLDTIADISRFRFYDFSVRIAERSNTLIL